MNATFDFPEQHSMSTRNSTWQAKYCMAAYPRYRTRPEIGDCVFQLTAVGVGRNQHQGYLYGYRSMGRGQLTDRLLPSIQCT